MAVEKEEFEDWDGGDFEALFPEVEEYDRESGFKPIKIPVVPWTELCDELMARYTERGLFAAEAYLSTVRSTHGGGHREPHPFIDALVELTNKNDAIETGRRAWGVLYDLLWPLAAASASRYIPDANRDEVMDVVHDTFLSLQVGRPLTKEDQFIPLLVGAAKNHALKFAEKMKEREVELVSIEDIRNDQGEPMALDELETPGMEHPWLTATTTETPESIATAADLSRLIASYGREVGDTEYAVFLAVEVDGIPLDRVALEFHNTPRTIRRWVEQVRGHVRDRLIENGYDL